MWRNSSTRSFSEARGKDKDGETKADGSRRGPVPSDLRQQQACHTTRSPRRSLNPRSPAPPEQLHPPATHHPPTAQPPCFLRPASLAVAVAVTSISLSPPVPSYYPPPPALQHLLPSSTSPEPSPAPRPAEPHPRYLSQLSLPSLPLGLVSRTQGSTSWSSELCHMHQHSNFSVHGHL